MKIAKTRLLVIGASLLIALGLMYLFGMSEKVYWHTGSGLQMSEYYFFQLRFLEGKEQETVLSRNLNEGETELEGNWILVNEKSPRTPLKYLGRRVYFNYWYLSALRSLEEIDGLTEDTGLRYHVARRFLEELQTEGNKSLLLKKLRDFRFYLQDHLSNPDTNLVEKEFLVDSVWDEVDSEWDWYSGG